MEFVSRKINNFVNEKFEEYFTFPQFFNDKIRGNAYFRRNNALMIETRFNQFWSNENINLIYGVNGINLVEFCAMNNIIWKEVGPEYKPISENINSTTNTPNPGVAYLYNRIDNIKSSYNVNDSLGNKTCYELFNNNDYINAHNNKLFSDNLSNTNDTRWQSENFPLGFSESPLTQEVTLTTNNFINEADFAKFRGRGFIQITGRANYKRLINFIVNEYNGDDNTINTIKNKWINSVPSKNLDRIATISTNTQWDKLFLNTSSKIAVYGIKIHAENAGNYHLIRPLSDLSTNQIRDGVENMGYRINGSHRYGNDLVKKTFQILNNLGFN